MNLSRTLIALGAAFTLGACAGGAATGAAFTMPAGSHCGSLSAQARDVSRIYGTDRIQRVEPLYAERPMAGASVRAGRVRPRYLAGAALFVPSPPDSVAYVQRVLSCHAAAPASADDHPNDPLRVTGLRSIEVSAEGPLLRIAIEASHSAAGRDVLNRARALRGSSTDVEVQQLARQTTRVDL